MHDQHLDDKPIEMKKSFKREISSLEGIFSFIEQFIVSQDIDSSIINPIQLAIEELFTNILKYQADGKKDVVIQLEKNEDQLVIQLQDFDSKPFDLTKAAEVNTDAYIQQKKPGGLGIHLVKHIVDSLDYNYHNGTSTITLIKKLEM